MPALPTDIAAAIRQQINVKVEDASIKARFPNARDGNLSPAEGYFDDPAHAQAALAQRAALIGVIGRTRVSVEIAEPRTDAEPVQTNRVVDSDLDLDASMFLARIEVDLEAGTSAEEYFG